MGGLFFSQAILPDFIYTEHDVYAILILEVPELAVISQTQSVYAEIWTLGGYAWL